MTFGTSGFSWQNQTIIDISIYLEVRAHASGDCTSGVSSAASVLFHDGRVDLAGLLLAASGDGDSAINFVHTHEAADVRQARELIAVLVVPEEMKNSTLLRIVDK